MSFSAPSRKTPAARTRPKFPRRGPAPRCWLRGRIQPHPRAGVLPVQSPRGAHAPPRVVFRALAENPCDTRASAVPTTPVLAPTLMRPAGCPPTRVKDSVWSWCLPKLVVESNKPGCPKIRPWTAPVRWRFPVGTLVRSGDVAITRSAVSRHVRRYGTSVDQPLLEARLFAAPAALGVKPGARCLQCRHDQQ